MAYPFSCKAFYCIANGRAEFKLFFFQRQYLFMALSRVISMQPRCKPIFHAMWVGWRCGELKNNLAIKLYPSEKVLLWYIHINPLNGISMGLMQNPQGLNANFLQKGLLWALHTNPSLKGSCMRAVNNLQGMHANPPENVLTWIMNRTCSVCMKTPL